MKVTFWHSDKPRERILADAFGQGVRAHGDDFEFRALQPTIEVADCDVAIMVGVKSRELFRAHFQRDVHVVMIDKGYLRHAADSPIKVWEYWRTSVDAHHPTAKLMKVNRPFDRLEKTCLPIPKPWRKASDRGHIVIAGSSKKYHDFYGLKEPNAWTAKLVKYLRALQEQHGWSAREIIYRPKPSYREAEPIAGTRFAFQDGTTIMDSLAGAHCLITHGSNACFEAALAGIPSIILGDGVAKPISSQSIKELESPFLAPMSLRAQWLANLAYCQWTQPEFASGEAWAILRPQIF